MELEKERTKQILRSTYRNGTEQVFSCKQTMSNL